MSNYTNENLINVPFSNVPAGTLAMKVGDNIFTAGNVTINQGSSMDFYKCSYVNSNSWGGYKAVFAGDRYEFQSNSTEGLTWSSVLPAVNRIYDSSALIEVKSIYTGFPQEGLILYVPLQASNSVTPTLQSLSYSGDYQFTQVDGISCIDFSEGSVQIGNFSSIPSTFTLSMMINTKTTQGWQNLFGTGHDSQLNAALLGNKFVFWGGGYTKGASSAIAINTNTWYHVCGVYYATVQGDPALKLYVNGQLVWEGQYTLPMTGTPCYIGRTSDNCYVRIAAVRMYNRTLSQSQITALANQFN